MTFQDREIIDQFFSAPAPNQSLFQKWRNVNLSSNSIDKTTQTLNQSQKADLPQNFLSMIANIGNTTIDEIEGDSEATTVMVNYNKTIKYVKKMIYFIVIRKKRSKIL